MTASQSKDTFWRRFLRLPGVPYHTLLRLDRVYPRAPLPTLPLSKGREGYPKVG